jgi:hypothetical protein
MKTNRHAGQSNRHAGQSNRHAGQSNRHAGQSNRHTSTSKIKKSSSSLKLPQSLSISVASCQNVAKTGHSVTLFTTIHGSAAIRGHHDQTPDIVLWQP